MRECILAFSALVNVCMNITNRFENSSCENRKWMKLLNVQEYVHKMYNQYVQQITL